MKSKSEVGELIEYFCTLVKTQFKSALKIFINDNSTEFVNTFVQNLFRSLGIVHQTSCIETSQQNGIAERKHKHLLNFACVLIFQSACPLKFWSECVLTAFFFY